MLSIDADRVRHRILKLRAEGHSLTVIACLVRRSRRHVARVLAEARRQYQCQQIAS